MKVESANTGMAVLKNLWNCRGIKNSSISYVILHPDDLTRLLKVNKSQKHFSWNSIAQKTNEILDKILP